MVHLRTLGDLRLEAAGAPTLSSRRKELVLLAYLARRGARPLGRAEAAALLWPDRDERRARQSLRQALLELRQAVGDGLVVEPDAIRLGAGAVEIDAGIFERLIDAGRPADAVELWGGDFLTGAEDVGGEDVRAWIEAEREGLRRRLALAFEGLVEDAQRRGDWRGGIALAERWTAALPLDQRGHLVLLRLLHLNGQGAEALSRWAILQSQLGALELDPLPELEQLARQIERTAQPVRPSSPRTAALGTPELVGRGAAFAELNAAWQAVPARGSAAVLVEGEPGAGRTRLCREFLRNLERGPGRILTLDVRPTVPGEPLAIVARLCAALAGAPGLAATPAASLAALASRSPEIAARYPQPGAPESSPQALSSALHDALTAVAEETPTVVLLDDIQAWDPASLDLVLLLAERCPAGVLLLATAVTGAEPSPAPLARSAIRRIKLQPLSRDDVELLLASVVELSPADRTSLATRLHRHAGGNPLLTVETIAALADEGLLVPGESGPWRLMQREGPLPLPAKVRELVAGRLAALSVRARRALEGAAVLGIPFDRQLLAEVTGDSPVAIESGLEELIRARLIRDNAGTFEPMSDLVRRYVEHAVPVHRGEELSARSAAALARLVGEREDVDAALRHHRARAARVTAARRRTLLLRFGAAAAIVAGIGITMALRRSAGPTSVSTIAVLPFGVSGSPDLAYLAEGMPSLLSAQLDGSGSLRSVDARAVLGLARQIGDGLPGVEQGRRVAAQLGAGTYVVGDIVEARGRIRITAMAYRGAVAGPAIARADVEGDTGDLFELVDGVAARLLTGLSAGPYEQLTRVAATTTASLPALKAYLDGERLFRQGDFQPAARAFQRAVVEDTTFSLAYYWLSVASWWADDSEGIDSSAATAVRYGDRLPERYRRLFQAWDAFLRGDPVEAERTYRQVVELEPENVEAWLQLGEVRFHSGPRRGYPMGAARQAFERVLYYEPEHTSALLHLARIAANESRLPALDSLTRRILELSPTGEWAVEARALHAFATGNAAEQREVVNALRTTGEGRVWNISRYLAIAAHSLDGAERLLGLLTEPTRPSEVRAFGHLALAHLDLARGRHKAAGAHLQRASRLDPVAALQHRALLATVPFLPADAALLPTLLDSLTGSAQRREPPSLETSHLANLHDAVEAELHAYLAAALSLRLGDTAGARRHADALTGPRQTPARAALASDASGSVRAQLALRAGRASDAVRDLQEVLRLEARVGLIGGSPFYSQGLERFLLADALSKAERLQEADRWYGSFSSNSIFDLIYMAPASLERGRLAERLGDPQAALGHYQQALALWLDSDPALRAVPDSARARIAALQMAREVATQRPSPRGEGR